MGITSITIAVALISGVASLLLIYYGRFGPRLHERPLCAGCRYDLSGRPTDSHVCSECGNDLRQPGSIQVGANQRRWFLLLPEYGLLSISGLLLILLQIGVVQDVNWYRLKPVWWLRKEAVRDGAQSPSLALEELVRRFDARILQLEEIGQLVDTALDIQGNKSKAWNTRWGDIVERAWEAGYANDDQILKYARQAVDGGIHLAMPRQVTIGKPIRMGLYGRGYRCADPSFLLIMVSVVDIEVNEDVTIPVSSSFHVRSLSNLLPMSEDVSVSNQIKSALKPGRFPVRCHFQVRISPIQTGGWPDDQLIQTLDLQAQADTLFVAPGESSKK